LLIAVLNFGGKMSRCMSVARPVLASRRVSGDFGLRLLPGRHQPGESSNAGAFGAVDTLLRFFGASFGMSGPGRSRPRRTRGIVVGFEAAESRAIADDLSAAGYGRLLRCADVQELPYILSVEAGEVFVIVNVDAFEHLGKAVDELRRLRLIAPKAVVVIASRRVGWHDTETHRASIADATLRLPYGQGAFAAVIAAAFENNADFRATAA